MSVGKIDYYQKYLKYKKRYLNAVNQLGGAGFHEIYKQGLVEAGMTEVLTPVPTSNDLLFVIDMQNDFSLPPAEGQGAFYVQDGEEVITPISNLIKKWPGPIIASIDYHNHSHCSFSTSPSHCSGPFPPHCVWGSNGAKLVNDIQTALIGKPVHYVYKGFFPDHDSFGAAQYPRDRACSRIIQCETGDFNASHTGSYKFTDIHLPEGLYPSNDYMNVKINNIAANQETETYQTCEKLLDSITPKKNIYVVGLAGDFCVLDTVLNLREKYEGTDTRVYFVLSHTRFAWLPNTILTKENDLSKIPNETHNKQGAFLTKPSKLLAELKKNNICNLQLT